MALRLNPHTQHFLVPFCVERNVRWIKESHYVLQKVLKLVQLRQQPRFVNAESGTAEASRAPVTSFSPEIFIFTCAGVLQGTPRATEGLSKRRTARTVKGPLSLRLSWVVGNTWEPESRAWEMLRARARRTEERPVTAGHERSPSAHAASASNCPTNEERICSFALSDV